MALTVNEGMMRLALDMKDLHDKSSVPPEATKVSKKEKRVVYAQTSPENSFKALLMLVAELFGALVGWKVPCSTC